jgi:hypothetical protein
MELAIEGVMMQATGRRVMVRRVDAVGVRPSSVEERLPRLIHLLERWALWSESFRMRLGYPSNSPGLSSGEGFGVRAESQADRIELNNCTLVDTAVGDLPPAQRAAINKRYGLAHAGVFRFPRDNYATLLDDAHEMLLKSLPRKGVDI